MPETKKVLFICLGNICRSPIAEAVFKHVVNEKGLQSKWESDSAALGGWHAGKPPDYRASDTLKRHNIPYNGIARQVTKSDFNEFDYIFGMDEENIADIKRKAPKDSTAEILLLGDFDPEGDRIIKDPYYDSDTEGFEKCFQQSMRCCNEFLAKHT